MHVISDTAMCPAEKKVRRNIVPQGKMFEIIAYISWGEITPLRYRPNYLTRAHKPVGFSHASPSLATWRPSRASAGTCVAPATRPRHLAPPEHCLGSCGSAMWPCVPRRICGAPCQLCAPHQPTVLRK